MESRYKWALGALVVAVIVVPYLQQSRGLRNNNPGNIRDNPRNTWRGASIFDFDDEFETFQAPEYGIRAIGKILDSYARRGITTMGEIIETWAPPSENDTDAYIASVASRTGLMPTDMITEERRVPLVAAIIHHENGVNPFSDEMIRYGLQLA